MAETKSATPACPLCGETMVRRKRHQDGSEFWGCPRYPRCRGVRQMVGEAATQPHRIDPDLQLQAGVRRRELTQARLAAGAGRHAAGGSARAEFERREAKHRRARDSARPWILLVGAAGVAAGVALLLFGPFGIVSGAIVVLASVVWTLGMLVGLPGHVRAWRIGAEGEEEVARRLAPLEVEGFRVLHDRLIPGKRANVDHIVVGPPGVFIVETKNYGTDVSVRGGEVYAGRRRRATIVEQARREADAVAAVVAPVPVTPLICVSQMLPWRKPELDGVRILGRRGLVRYLRSAPQTLEPGQVAELADRIEAGLRPAGPELPAD